MWPLAVHWVHSLLWCIIGYGMSSMVSAITTNSCPLYSLYNGYREQCQTKSRIIYLLLNWCFSCKATVKPGICPQEGCIIFPDPDSFVSSWWQIALDEATSVWGIKVERVEIKDVKLPLQLQRAMAAEAEATREARAKVKPSQQNRMQPFMY